MERDRARALAKSRGDRGPDLTKVKGKKRNQELEPGKRGWNGRKETLRSSDLEDSDLEDDEQDFGEEIEMEGDWEAEDDEVSDTRRGDGRGSHKEVKDGVGGMRKCVA